MGSVKMVIEPSILAEVFHNFPHVDFNFHNATNIFTPDNKQYQQALLFNAAYILFVALSLFLIFGIYFLVVLCYFSQNHTIPQKEVNGRQKCFRFMIGCFGICSLLAVGVALYGNYIAEVGVKQFSNSTAHIFDHFDLLNFMNNQVTNLHINDASKQVEMLKEKVAKSRETAEDLENITTLLVDVNKDLQLTGNLLQDITMDVIKNRSSIWIRYDYYRSSITISLLCFHVLLVLILLFAMVTLKKWTLVILTFTSILSFLFMMSTISFSVPIAIAAADVCKHPKEAYLVYVDGHLAEELMTSYLGCSTNNSNNQLFQPYKKDKGKIEIATTIIRDVMNNDSVIKSANETKVLLSDLSNSTTDLKNLIKLSNCRYINKEYNLALDAICTAVLEGFSLLILFCLVISLFLVFLLSCITPLWKAIRSPGAPSKKDFSAPSFSDSNESRDPGSGDREHLLPNSGNENPMYHSMKSTEF